MWFSFMTFSLPFWFSDLHLCNNRRLLQVKDSKVTVQEKRKKVSLEVVLVGTQAKIQCMSPISYQIASNIIAQ